MTRQRRCLAALSLLALWFPAAATAKKPDPRFPSPGTPYLQARKDLLRQGLTIAPDRPRKPSRRYREVDCELGPSDCRALFIFHNDDGWGQYVVVELAPDGTAISEARFAAHMDGLFAIPPPEAHDVPAVRGNYLRARVALRRLGYRPLRVFGGPGGTCSSEKKCSPTIPLPEAQCFADEPICNAFWRAPDGRLLWVMTLGETRGGNVHYKAWTERRAWPGTLTPLH